MAKKVSINVRAWNDGEIVLRKVNGAEEVVIDKYPAERFFVHKLIDIKGWTLTEYKTGLAVARGVRTKSECIQKAINALEDGSLGNFLRRIDMLIASYGYANEGVQDGKAD